MEQQNVNSMQNINANIHGAVINSPQLCYHEVQYVNANRQGYFVYKDESVYVYVESDTAIEAIKKSRITEPYKVERANILRYNLLSLEESNEV